jgi:hypothetical protein
MSEASRLSENIWIRGRGGALDFSNFIQNYVLRFLIYSVTYASIKSVEGAARVKISTNFATSDFSNQDKEYGRAMT